MEMFCEKKRVNAKWVKTGPQGIGAQSPILARIQVSGLSQLIVWGGINPWHWLAREMKFLRSENQLRSPTNEYVGRAAGWDYCPEEAKRASFFAGFSFAHLAAQFLQQNPTWRPL